MIKEFAKKILPEKSKKFISKGLRFFSKRDEYWLLINKNNNYKKAIRKIKEKNEPIHIVFLAIFKSVWKYDSVYRLLENDPRFKLTVLVCPAVNMGKDHMKETLNECFIEFQQRGYNPILSYNEKTGEYVNVRDLKPDIIFYTSPYDGLVDDRYYIKKFPDILSVYVNYGYSTCKYSWGTSLIFHKLLWRYYAESESIKNFIEISQNRRIKGVKAVGYPPFDDYISKQFNDKDWKIKSPKLKKVIWAPHHTIEDVDTNEWIQFSTFFKYADFMNEVAQKYKDQIQFVFKPHPLLKQKLYDHPQWGKEKTDKYFGWWENGGTTNYVSGEYRDLFLSSDSMIHDCGSFTTEYLYTQKPVMYLSGYNHENQLNDVGKKAYFSHYIGQNKDDITQFLEKVVLEGKDPMKEKREIFFQEELLPPNGKTVAENMRDDILNAIGIKEFGI